MALDLDSSAWTITIITITVALQIVLPIISIIVVNCRRCAYNRKLDRTASEPVRNAFAKKELENKKKILQNRRQTMYKDWTAELNNARETNPGGIELQEYPQGSRQSVEEINDRFSKMNMDMNVEMEDLEETEDPKRRFRKKMTVGRVLSVHLMVSFWLWAGYLGGCYATECYELGPVMGILLFVSYGMVPFAYFFVIFESCCARENKYLGTMRNLENATALIDTMRAKCPVFSMTAEAWHLELRTRTTSFVDANGNIQYRTETYYEKVVTHVQTEEFRFNYWVDESDTHLPGIRHHGVTTIKMSCFVKFGDVETTNAFNEAYMGFQARTRGLDEHVDYSTSQYVPGFKKHVAAYMDKNTVPTWMTRGRFWCVTVIMCTWPFRHVFNKNVGKAEYGVFKQIYMTPPRDKNPSMIKPYADVSQTYQQV